MVCLGAEFPQAPARLNQPNPFASAPYRRAEMATSGPDDAFCFIGMLFLLCWSIPVPPSTTEKLPMEADCLAQGSVEAA
jgi:hypothetical protein